MSDVQYYQGLAKSMMLAIILVSFTPLLIITLIAGYQYNVAYGERVDAHLRELVLKHDQAVDAYLEGKVEELRVLAEVVGVDQLRDEKSAANLLATLNRMHVPTLWT